MAELSARLAKLNHILIPRSRAERDRWRRSRTGRWLAPLVTLVWRSTNEGRTLSAIAGTSMLLGIDTMGTDAHLLALLLFGSLAGTLLVSGRFGMPGVRLEVSCPPRVTMGEPLRFTVLVRNESAVDLDRVRVLGPFLPWDGRWVGEPPRALAVRAGGVGRAQLEARFLQRGQHHLDPVHAGRVVPPGLALGPLCDGPGPRFVVVPPVARVESLRVPRPRDHRVGVPLGARAGSSVDLLGVRPYRPGDRARDLHAKTWARTGVPSVREYQEEVVTAVGVLLDPSGEDDEHFDARLSLTAGILRHLVRAGTNTELLIAAEPPSELSLGARRSSFEHALDLLACQDPSQPPPPDALASRVARQQTPWVRALLVCGQLGPWQRAVAERLTRMGIPCGLLAVVPPGEREGLQGDERTLSSKRVLEGEALWL